VDLDGLAWIPDAAYYTKVDKTYDDWSGEYLVTYTTSSTVKLFNSFSGSDKGASTVDLFSKLTADGIPAEDGDPYKAVIEKVGTYYSVNIAGIGYIGLESDGNKVHKSSSAPSSGNTKYLWTLSYKDGGLWLVNASYNSRRLQWNTSASCFRCYTGSQKELTLYRRTTSAGSVTPKPDPTPDPTPDPDPDPTPDPDIPEPIPGISGKYSWYELPEISYTQSGSYLIDSSDKNLYYAHHLCAGNEKGPGGRKARNYTVCFSAEHHCPVWVAAPRHTMYQSGASRTDAYAKDPSIPSDIQYNSKSTGGGCNKGHMLGSAERLSSTATNKQVFYYSNIAPQYSSTFNTGGGGWNTLEDCVDGQVCSDTLYVVIGAYFDKFTDRRGYSEPPAKISFGGRNDVSRPTMFYYILLRTKNGATGKPLSQCTADEIKCAAFVRSHAIAKGTKVGEQDMMSVSDLEKITGFTYFPNVPQAPKDSYKASDWGL
jgi:DNA/RNA endonuclease G (NUC1)